MADPRFKNLEIKVGLFVVIAVIIIIVLVIAIGISRDIFNRIWVGHPFSESDAETLSDMLTDTGLPATDREMWLGAVTLGLLAAFDRRRVDLLARVYSSDECRLSVAALTGLVLGAFIHGGTGRHSADFSEVFEALSSSKYFYDDLTTTVLELLRACSTGDVSRKISRDIMPGMMAQGRKLMDELGIDAADPFKASANPRKSCISRESSTNSGNSTRCRPEALTYI